MKGERVQRIGYNVQMWNIDAKQIPSQPRTSVRGNRIIDIRNTKYELRFTIHNSFPRSLGLQSGEKGLSKYELRYTNYVIRITNYVIRITLYAKPPETATHTTSCISRSGREALGDCPIL